MSVRLLIKINVVFLLLAAGLYFYSMPFLIIPRVFIGLSVFFLSGINLTAIFGYILKKRFNFFEFISFSIIFAFFILPLILVLEFILLEKVYSFLPLINVSFILISLALIKVFGTRSSFKALPEIPVIEIKQLVRHPVFVCGLFFLAVIISTTFTYNHLPDNDPYTWISRLGTLYDKSSLSSITSRPLFSALFYYLKELTGTSLFAIFKYLVPFFLILPLAPAWLVASQLKNNFQKYLVLLIPLAVPNTILYSQMAMPQAIMIIFTFYFAFFLVYAYLSKQEIFYYLGGFLLLLTIFYYEAAIIIFIIWLAITLIYNFKLILKNKLILFLIVLIFISNYDILLRYISFVTKWTYKISHLLINNPVFNYLYPYQYINVDGHNMGWSSIGGILKFYGFYAGPLIVFLIIFTLFYLYKNKTGFKKIIRHYFNHKELTVILLSFLAFFAISEILPRFPGIAMLPDRAWIFAGIFFICAILPFINFKYFANFYKPIFYLFVFLVIIGIYGAFFINYQKKYLISQADIKAAEWIENNLPANRIFFSTGKKTILNYYSKSKPINVPPEFYFSENYKNFIEMPKSCVQVNNFSIETADNYLKNLTDEAEKTRLKLNQAQNTSSEISISLNFAKQNQNATAQFIKDIKNTTNTSKLSCNNKYYIFYSEIDPKNPYSDRPYSLNKWGVKNPDNKEIIFDKFPESFRRIYSDSENKIYIWEIL